eukprot:2144297-Amphidinium_carterae.1
MLIDTTAMLCATSAQFKDSDQVCSGLVRKPLWVLQAFQRSELPSFRRTVCYCHYPFPMGCLQDVALIEALPKSPKQDVSEK